MDLRSEYERLLAGTHDTSCQSNVHFYVYSTSLDEGRGDVFVALGLARALDALGWGVSFAARSQWDDAAPETTTVTVSMLPTADAKTAPAEAVRIGWARNAIREWSGQDFINRFDGMLASSSMALKSLNECYFGLSEVMPIAVDPDLFYSEPGERDIPVITTVNYWDQDRGLISALKNAEPKEEIYWYGNNLECLEVRSANVVRRAAVSYLKVPELYRRSRIILDDLTVASKEHGCQNSRLFEGLASGALVVTNERLGLEELGLADIPVFENDSTLEEILEEVLSNEGETSRRVALLRAEVLRRHTFHHRARQFADFVAAVECTARSRRKLVAAYEEKASSYEVAEREIERLRKESRMLSEGLMNAQYEISQFRNRRVVKIADRFTGLLHRSARD